MAASTSIPSISTTDTSITPVSIDVIPESIKIGKLPFRAQLKKFNRVFGGAPSAGAKWSIQFDGVIILLLSLVS